MAHRIGNSVASRGVPRAPSPSIPQETFDQARNGDTAALERILASAQKRDDEKRLAAEIADKHLPSVENTKANDNAQIAGVIASAWAHTNQPLDKTVLGTSAAPDDDDFRVLIVWRYSW